MEQRRCFVIGPQQDSDKGRDARLKMLVREVLRPLFDEIERRDGIRYTVRTPYDVALASGRMTNGILYEIDRADIVIADLTNSRPNVFYELGITHALGRACVTIMEQGGVFHFDIAAYRCHILQLEGDDPNRFLEAQQELRPALETAHRYATDWNRWENPVIDFFRAPITYISPAYSLALGYYRNFIKRVGEALITRKQGDYLHDIHIGTAPEAKPHASQSMRALEKAERGQLDLCVIVPTRLDVVKPNSIDRLAGTLVRCYPEHNGREYPCYFQPDEKHNRLQVIDLPTTVSVMEDAVARRMPYNNTPRDSSDWIEVERQELDRFAAVLRVLIAEHEDNPVFSQRVKIMRYDPTSPADLLWLHNVLQS